MYLPTFIIAICIIYTHASVSDYISPSDIKRLNTVLLTAHSDLNISNAYYLAKGLVNVNEQPPRVIYLDACGYLNANFKNDLSPEEIFYALNAWSLLKCNDPSILKDLKRQNPNLHSDETIKILKAILAQEDINTTNLHYALEALTFLRQPIPNADKIGSNLAANLKDDTNFISVGHTLHAASLLGNYGKFAASHISDLLTHADEIDSRMLNWEGGLTATGLLLTGILRLPDAKPLSQVQADKFAAYLLTRKTVQHPRGVVTLLDAALALATSKVPPLSIGFIKSAQVIGENPVLRIRVSDILGRPLKPAPSAVIAQSATRVTDDVVIVSKQPLQPTKDATEFGLTLVKVHPGLYRLSIAVGSDTTSLTFRVLGPVTLNWLEAGLGDADGSSAPRLTRLEHPKKLSSPLQADSSQHLIVRFSLTRSVHQPFLRLSAGKREIVFVAEQDSTKAYKIDVNLASELTYSAVFDMELILGDSLISNPLRWAFGQVDVKLGTSDSKQSVVRGPRPEIKHMFRPAEKRPPQVVSMLFTALAAAPLLLLLIIWLKLGINLTNFSITAFAFHAGLAGIFGLFTLFWLRLDMFTTCGWLLPLGGFTFLAGHHVLSKLAKQKKA